MDNSRFSKITHIADLIICSVWLLLVAHEEISGWMINSQDIQEIFIDEGFPSVVFLFQIHIIRKWESETTGGSFFLREVGLT